MLLQVSCASTTIINSSPSGAKLYIDGAPVGRTPYTYTDTKIVGSTTMIRLKKPGCQTVNTVISRSESFSVGACIGGAFVLVPFLWIMGYNPSRNYELDCNSSTQLEDEPANIIAEIQRAKTKIQSSCQS